jgi:hypothetical protein
MAMYGVDCEESTLGQDVAKDSRSYFGHLLNQGSCRDLYGFFCTSRWYLWYFSFRILDEY